MATASHCSVSVEGRSERKEMTDEEFEFYDKIYHPQTGGSPRDGLFKIAFIRHQVGTFDAEEFKKALRISSEARNASAKPG